MPNHPQAQSQVPSAANSHNTTLPHGPQQVPTPRISPAAQVTFSATFNGQPIAPGMPHQPNQTPPTQNAQADQNSQAQPQTVQPTPISQPQPASSPVNTQQQAQAEIPPHVQLQMQQMNAFHAQIQAQIANQIAALHQHPALSGQTQVRFGSTAQPSPNTHPFPNQPGFFHHNTQNFQPMPHVVPLMPTNVIPAHPSHTHPTVQHAYQSAHSAPGHSEQENGGAHRGQPSPSQEAATHSTAPVQTSFSVGPNNNTHIPQVPILGINGIANINQGIRSSSSNGTLRHIPHIQPTNLQRPDSSHSIYLLSSPSGPHALLMSPSGFYTAPWMMPPPPVHSRIPTSSNLENVAHAPSNSGTSGQVTQPTNANQTGPPPQNQLVQRQQDLPAPGNPNEIPANNQPRDMARLFLQLSSHMWMLIRLLGFIWFFSHGASLSRTMFLVSLAFVVFLGQLGHLQGLWQAVRRYADNLLPIAGHEQPNPARRRAAPNAPGPSTERRPTLEEINRQSTDGQPQEGNVARQAFRRFERAAALFVASLAPGVAERHIQAREAAEAARQREIREREDRERKEEEERQLRANEGPSQSEGGNASGSADTGGAERQGLVEV